MNGRRTEDNLIQSLSKAMDVIRSVQVDVNRASRERAYKNAIKVIFISRNLCPFIVQGTYK